MENNNVTPEPRKTKREELIDALTMDYVGMALYHKNRAIAERVVDRVIQAGWQWHPVATEWNLDHNMVALPNTTPEQEIDMLDRIVHGLPARVPGFRASQWPDSIPTDVKIVDVASLHPEVVNEWVRIPTWENYEICKLGLVRNRWTKRVLEFVNDGEDNEDYVDMHDKEGFSHICHIKYLMEQTFGTEGK